MMYSHVDCNTAEKLRAAKDWMFRCDPIIKLCGIVWELHIYLELLGLSHPIHFSHVVACAVDTILLTGTIDFYSVRASNDRFLGSILLRVLCEGHPAHLGLSL